MFHEKQQRLGIYIAFLSFAGAAATAIAQPVHNLTQGTDHDTLQQAIDVAVGGDEIVADMGTYAENIDFLGKAITFRSADPNDPAVVAATIIDGQSLATCVTMSAGTLSGFTIQHGSGADTNAGGVEASATSVVSFNVITDNFAEQRGGGVSATESTLVHNNWITNNTAGNRAGGVSARDDAVVMNNVISGNHAILGGGGIRAQENSLIRNNTITFNSSEDTGGGIIGGGGVLAEEDAAILSNVIAFSSDGVGIHIEPGGTAFSNFNCVFGNIEGEYSERTLPGASDLNVDPLLDADGVHLLLTSPCLDAGDPSLLPLDSETDIDGESRVYVSRVDVGVDEARDCNGNGVIDEEDIANETSTDCDGNGIPDECISIKGGVVFLSGDDADDSNHCHGTSCGALYPNIFSYCIANSKSPGSGIVAIGVNGTPALTGLNSWNDPANGGPGAPLTIITTPEEIQAVDFTQYAMVYIPSVSNHTSGGITPDQLDALNLRQATLVHFVNNIGGALLALTQADVDNGYGWLPLPIETADQQHIDVCPTAALTDELSPNSTCANMSHCCYHTIFTGPPGFMGLDVLAVSTDVPAEQVLIIGGADILIRPQARLIPADEHGITGQPHTLFLQVSEAENPCIPIPDLEVTFEVLSGPNAGVMGIEVTNEQGAAAFTYVGVQDQGTDQIRASLIDPRTRALVVSNIAFMAWAFDCNENGVADNEDISTGVSNDCNKNGVPDECGLADGTSGDCNANGIPDECDTADGTSPDCNDNSVPDSCELTQPVVLSSPVLGPVGAGFPQLHVFEDVGLAVDQVTISITASADLESEAEFIVVSLNDTLLGTFFGSGGGNCADGGETEQLIMSADAFNAALERGVAEVLMVASLDVDPGTCPEEFIQVSISYLRSQDCNFNDQPDDCDVPDCNHNDAPDSCDIANGTSGDADGDQVPDECEHLPCCDSPALCDGDVNGDGVVDPLDAGAILARFGLDPSDPELCGFNVNCDGELDPLDSGYVLARFGTCDPIPDCPAGCEDFACPGTGDCCVESTEPGCSDADCCNAVCDGDHFCCNVVWDQLCADTAVATCVVCEDGGEGEGESERGE